MFNKRLFGVFTILCSLTLISHADLSHAKPRSAGILKKEIKLDQLVLKAEQDFNKTIIAFRTSDNKKKTEEIRKKAAKISQRLKDLYQKRSDFIARLIKSATTKKLATFNEIVLTTFLYEFRTRRVGGYAERSWTRAEKRDLKRCPDIVSDGVLNQWALGLTEAKPGLYADSLARIVQGMECYSMAEALSFSRDLARAYQNTLQRFGHNKEFLSRAKSYLLYSTANLFIVVQDLTKVYGPTPLYELIRDNRRALGEVFMDRYSPVHIAGYWLYDMKLDRMIAVGPLCESLRYKKVDKTTGNCVSATATLDALIDPRRLGLASCLLTDMISPVFDVKLGYLCQRDVCSESGHHVPAVRQAIDNKKTAYGVSLDSLRESRDCPEGSKGGGSNAGIVGVLGDSQSYMECITETLLAEQKGQQACFVAVVNQGRSARFGFAPAPAENDNCSDPLVRGRRGDKKLTNKLKKAFNEALEEFTEEEIEILEEFLRNAQLTNDRNRCPKVCLEEEDDYYILVFNRRYLKETNNEDLKNDEELVLRQIIHEQPIEEPEPPVPDPPPGGDDDDDDDFFCWAWEDNCPPDASENEGGDEYCSPDVGDCNNCSALSGLQQATLDCFVTNDEAIPSRPGLPETIMPLPWDNPDAPAWAACLEQQEGPDDALACSNIECGEGIEPSLDENGECVCRVPAVPVGRDPEPIDCPQGTTPVIGPGGVPLCSGPVSDGHIPAN